MERTLGVDHGTKGIRFCLLEGRDKRFFEIDRKGAAEVSVLDALGSRGFLDVELIGLTFSMADAIGRITDVRQVKNRGQMAQVTGTLVGGGTRLFDEIARSGKRAVLIPGLHRGVECLDERFRLLYSHMAASEKVALSYHAFNVVNSRMVAANMIISDISSNTVSIGVKDSRFFGAVDACLGAPGLLHGPLDLGLIRNIDAGKTTANEAFYRAGISHKPGVTEGETQGGKLVLNALCMAVEMEVAGLVSMINPRAIAIAGSAGIHENLFGELKKELRVFGPVFRLEEQAAAVGAAEIARDMLQGKRDFLGIGVDF